MPTRARKKKSKADEAEDLNSIAKRIVDQTTGQEPPREKNPWAVALGKLGASKGGKARANKLSKKRLSEIAKHAAKTRWSKSGQDTESSSSSAES
jgi:hypothetical protein